MSSTATECPIEVLEKRATQAQNVKEEWVDQIGRVHREIDTINCTAARRATARRTSARRARRATARSSSASSASGDPVFTEEETEQKERLLRSIAGAEYIQPDGQRGELFYLNRDVMGLRRRINTLMQEREEERIQEREQERERLSQPPCRRETGGKKRKSKKKKKSISKKKKKSISKKKRRSKTKRRSKKKKKSISKK